MRVLNDAEYKVHYLQYIVIYYTKKRNNFYKQIYKVYLIKIFPASDGARACWLLVANDVEREGELEDERVDGGGGGTLWR